MIWTFVASAKGNAIGSAFGFNMRKLLNLLKERGFSRALYFYKELFERIGGRLAYFCRLIAAFHQLAALVTALPNIPIAKKNRKINKVFFSGATIYTKATLNFGFWKWKNAINYGENKKWKPIFKVTTV
jgi:hypothetical protein